MGRHPNTKTTGGAQDSGRLLVLLRVVHRRRGATLRSCLRLLTSALELSFQNAVAIQPSGAIMKNSKNTNTIENLQNCNKKQKLQNYPKQAVSAISCSPCQDARGSMLASSMPCALCKPGPIQNHGQAFFRSTTQFASLWWWWRGCEAGKTGEHVVQAPTVTCHMSACKQTQK